MIEPDARIGNGAKWIKDFTCGCGARMELNFFGMYKTEELQIDAMHKGIYRRYIGTCTATEMNDVIRLMYTVMDSRCFFPWPVEAHKKLRDEV